MDPELIQRLEESIWLFFNRLASIQWEAWSDAGIVQLLMTIVAIGFAAILLVWLWRRWIATALGLAGVALTIIWLASRPAPEPTYYVPEPKPGIQIPVWIWGLLIIGLLLYALWRSLGPEGRRELRVSVLRQVRSSGIVIRLIGPPTPEWTAKMYPPELAEGSPDVAEEGG